MYREEKLSGIQGHQREWPEPTICRLNVQVGEARLHCIRMNSTPHLTAETVMMQSAKDALITPNGVHFGKIEFLPLMLPYRPARAFRKCLLRLPWPLLTQRFLDNKLSFRTHMRENTRKMLRNTLAFCL